MRRMLTAKLNNSTGVLNRFTGVLSRRQVNIESISVGHTDVPHISRITIIIDVDSIDEVEQIIKQLNRQVDGKLSMERPRFCIARLTRSSVASIISFSSEFPSQ